MAISTKKAKPVKAWANLTSRGRLDGGLVSTVRALIEARTRIPRRYPLKMVRVTISIEDGKK